MSKANIEKAQKLVDRFKPENWEKLSHSQFLFINKHLPGILPLSWVEFITRPHLDELSGDEEVLQINDSHLSNFS